MQQQVWREREKLQRGQGGLKQGEEAGDNTSSEQNLLIATCFLEKGKLTFHISCTEKSKYSEPMACLSTFSKQEILPQGSLTALSCCHPLQAAAVGTSPPWSAAMSIIQKGEKQENVYHHWARYWLVPQFPSAQAGKHSESCLGTFESSRVSSGKFCRNNCYFGLGRQPGQKKKSV